jgi:hypothetical protein
MRHPLDGARLKIVRAQKHLDSLKDEISRYLDTHPYEFPTEHEGNVVAARPAIVSEPPPLELGCIAGDCFSNLRKSLDYIAWELLTLSLLTALFRGNERRLQTKSRAKPELPSEMRLRYRFLCSRPTFCANGDYCAKPPAREKSQGTGAYVPKCV